MGVDEWLRAVRSASKYSALPFAVRENRIVVTGNVRQIRLWKTYVFSLAVYTVFALVKSYGLYRQLKAQEKPQILMILDLNLCLTWGFASSIILLVHTMTLRKMKNIPVLMNSFAKYLETFTGAKKLK